MAAGFLVVGLWPFAFRPFNHVAWLKDRPGLSFEPDGIAYESEAADWSPGSLPDQPAGFTVELWLEPGLNPSNNVFHILTMDDGQYPSGVALCQWKTELLLRVRNDDSKWGFRELGVNGALANHTRRFITLAADQSGTAFYSDGSPSRRHPSFLLPASMLKGRLILGNAAAGKHPWTGNLLGLAVFNRALDAAEVARHHALWTNHQAVALAAEPGIQSLYLFDEGSGSQAKDRSANGRRLLIPERYHVLQKRILEPPWGPGWHNVFDWGDIVINLLGFVPFGFILFKHRRMARPDGGFRNIAWVVAVGAAISLAIELTQVWLPNRSSSATDLFCNTLGTFLGVLLARRIGFKT